MREGRWAGEERDRFGNGGTRPVSICSAVEVATRETAIARGNAIAHSAEIAENESVSAEAHVCSDTLQRFSKRTRVNFLFA